MASETKPFCSYHSAARWMQFRKLVRICLPKLVAQHIRKEMMIAIPAALLIQGNEEQVCGLQLSQHGLAICALRQPVTQLTRHPVQDRRLQQKGPHLFGLAAEHFRDQIIRNVMVAAGEGGNETRRYPRTLCIERGVWMASAASCSPAIQPSVRCSNAGTCHRRKAPGPSPG